ncbi:MAG: hypothetical protein QXZ17_15675 [Nitrososphaerota archaeon]
MGLNEPKHTRESREEAKKLVLETLEGGPKKLSELQEETGLGKMRLIRALHELEKLGFVEHDNRSSRWSSTRYYKAQEYARRLWLKLARDLRKKIVEDIAKRYKLSPEERFHLELQLSI